MLNFYNTPHGAQLEAAIIIRFIAATIAYMKAIILISGERYAIAGL